MLTGYRDISDFFAVVIAHGLFDRFPKLRDYVCRERWRPGRSLKNAMKKAYSQNPRSFSEDPVEVFDRHVGVTPFWEDPIDEVIETIEASRITFGSDWPHTEGTEHPLDYLATLEGLDDSLQHRIMHDNAMAALAL